MLTCLACAVRHPQLICSRAHSNKVTSGLKGCTRISISTGTRSLSSAAAVAVQQKAHPDDVNAERQNVSTVLHKTRALLPRILPSHIFADSSKLSLPFWSDLLARAYENLSFAKGDDTIRIAGTQYRFLTLRFSLLIMLFL